MLRGLFIAGAIALGVAGAPAIQAAPPTTTSPSPSPAPTAGASVPPTTSATPACVGLSICPPPPPDAEGNPACYYADGWRADNSGTGIEAWYFEDPKSPSKPDKVTASVRKKDGTTESQDATIEAGQQVHRFEFPAIPQSAVDEVLFITGAARCFVIGPA